MPPSELTRELDIPSQLSIPNLTPNQLKESIIWPRNGVRLKVTITGILQGQLAQLWYSESR